MSPIDVAPICQVNKEHLYLTCNASLESITWNLLQRNDNGSLVDIFNEITFSTDGARTFGELILNTSILFYRRVSRQYDMPLITELLIDSVSLYMNETVIRCSNKRTQPVMSASTTIKIIDRNQSEFIKNTLRCQSTQISLQTS